MPYIPDSEANAEFAAALQAYQAALSAEQLADGFADGRTAPPIYDPENVERSFYAYASWYSVLGTDLSVYTAADIPPPVPLPLA